uniref:NADH-ubiquinone oxidoreductase chain 6 n=1 Tax=Sinopyrophorus schimmeli TaxID=2488820 RepID=A0A3G5FPR5_9COLE|nr:NADH dehydrogenase subunit 6 [Elateridae sp. JWH-2018]
MMQVLFMLTLSMSLTFSLVNHPLSMGLILLIQTILIALITGMMSNSFWFSYILFMIMIGGMLVLFIYMTSVASNEKMKFSTAIAVMLILLMMITLLSLTMEKFFSYQMMTNMDISASPQHILSLVKYLSYPNSFVMTLMIVYLLIALIAVVKITNISYGPLRQKF